MTLGSLDSWVTGYFVPSAQQKGEQLIVAAGGSTTVVLIAMGANFGIACAKFAASAWTGSSAMLSEAIHSVVDTCNQALLLFGIKRSTRKADEAHPFGYSKELYFWSFIVAIVLFSLGAGVSIYEGIDKFFHPHKIEHADIIYVVLGLAIGMEGFSTYKALAEFRTRYAGRKFVSALKKSKDPALFAIVLEDIAAIFGLFVALIGVLIADKLGYTQADGIASIAIGLVLAAVAIFMAIEIKSLIIGEAADPEVQSGLFRIINAHTGETEPILAINEIRTMHLGPLDILVAASVDFRDGTSSETVEATTNEIEQEIKAEFPSVRKLFIEVQSIESHANSVSDSDDHAHKDGGSKAADAVTVADVKSGSRADKPAKANTPAPSARGKRAGSGSGGPQKAGGAKPTADAAEPDLEKLPVNRKGRKGKRRAAKAKRKKG